MAIELLEAKRADPRTIAGVADHPPVEAETRLEDERTMPARGIAAALLLSIPFWALIAFLLYLLL